jgi:hypothetical protein
MVRKALWALGVALLLATPMAVQAQGMGDYLDVFTVKAKPEKAADLRAITKKMVDANRRNNGDHWLTSDTVYGEGDTIVFVSLRQDYADIDKGQEAFYGALTKAYGREGTEKLLQDFENCVASERTELRRRRPDLSRKAPDAAEYAKFIGESRLVRTTVVHIRAGRVAEFEELEKEIKAAAEKNPNAHPTLVSQVVEGGTGSTFYISTLRSSMGGFDKNPTIQEILGEDGYKKYVKVGAEAVESVETALGRFDPELSNPPEDIVAAAPDYWQPKAVMASAAKPKATKAPTQKPKQ